MSAAPNIASKKIESSEQEHFTTRDRLWSRDRTYNLPVVSVLARNGGSDTNMGWIRGPRPLQMPASAARERAKESIEHVEDISNVVRHDIPAVRHETSEPDTIYSFRPLTEPDKDLPFISAEIVRSKRRPGALSGKMNDPEESRYYWIVVDDIVYDCSSFIMSHPGGEQVILSFVGEDCSCMCPSGPSL